MLRAARRLFAVPAIVSAQDARAVIASLLTTLTPERVAQAHDESSFFAICQQLGLSINADDCNTPEKRAALAREAFHKMERIFLALQ